MRSVGPRIPPLHVTLSTAVTTVLALQHAHMRATYLAWQRVTTKSYWFDRAEYRDAGPATRPAQLLTRVATVPMCLKSPGGKFWSTQSVGRGTPGLRLSFVMYRTWQDLARRVTFLTHRVLPHSRFLQTTSPRASGRPWSMGHPWDEECGNRLSSHLRSACELVRGSVVLNAES